MKHFNFKSICNIFRWVVVILIVITGGILAMSALDMPGGLKLYSVQSGSMAPSIQTGSVVFSKSFAEYEVGNVITFKSESERNNSKPSVTTTHRIVKVQESDGKTLFTTKGDANDTADSSLVDKELVLGKVVFSIPLFGHIVAFSRTQIGLVTLIIIPSTIIVYSEFLNIKNEIQRILKERSKQKFDKENYVKAKIPQSSESTSGGIHDLFTGEV